MLFAGADVDFAELGNVHIPAAMLKSFLRQLPEPLLTYELYDHIIHVQCSYLWCCLYLCCIVPVSRSHSCARPLVTR